MGKKEGMGEKYFSLSLGRGGGDTFSTEVVHMRVIMIICNVVIFRLDRQTFLVLCVEL